ncbi:MAG: hypothetical protein HDT35_07135 [Clostridiales bacterium]|nr:hypothetical protein [Clostridiales bacterium]
MECEKCGTAMIDAQLCTGMHGIPPYLAHKRGKGAFEPEHRCYVDCFVCPACGKIEFYAQDAQKLPFA